jgi:hypothetical protein
MSFSFAYGYFFARQDDPLNRLLRRFGESRYSLKGFAYVDKSEGHPRILVSACPTCPIFGTSWNRLENISLFREEETISKIVLLDLSEVTTESKIREFLSKQDFIPFSELFPEKSNLKDENISSFLRKRIHCHSREPLFSSLPLFEFSPSSKIVFFKRKKNIAFPTQSLELNISRIVSIGLSLLRKDNEITLEKVFSLFESKFDSTIFEKYMKANRKLRKELFKSLNNRILSKSIGSICSTISSFETNSFSSSIDISPSEDFFLLPVSAIENISKLSEHFESMIDSISNKELVEINIQELLLCFNSILLSCSKNPLSIPEIESGSYTCCLHSGKSPSISWNFDGKTVAISSFGFSLSNFDREKLSNLLEYLEKFGDNLPPSFNELRTRIARRLSRINEI